MNGKEIPNQDFIAVIRGDFPILQKRLYENKPLIYFDSAATSQKPQCVIDRLAEYYAEENANVHRGIHALSARATEFFESAREKLRAHLNAKESSEIIFTSGTTDAINLAALTWGRQNIGEGDVIVLTEMEHHSNIVPWQMLAAEKKARLKFVPLTEKAELDLEAYRALLKEGVKLVAVTQMSNVFGTVNPLREMIAEAHNAGAKVLVDGAQAAPHMAIDVQKLDADFFALSAHKMMGPTGIGALYAKRENLENMPPLRGGGEMIRTVTKEGFSTADLPYKFEAGTPNIAGAVGWGDALDYIRKIGLEIIRDQEKALTAYTIPKLLEIENLRILGDPGERGGIISFVIEGIHPHDLAQLLDRYGVAIRSGHHCAQPALQSMGVEATARISFYVYNTFEEVDLFLDALKQVIRFF